MSISLYIKDKRGFAALEMGIVLPILMLLLFCILEVGTYFVKSQIATRSVSTVATSIQSNPSNPDLRALANQSGLSMLDLSKDPNYICAKSYNNFNDAKIALCEKGEWQTSAPAAVNSDGSYYVAIVAYAHQKTMTDFFSAYLPDITQKTVIQVDSTRTKSPVIGMKVVEYTPTAIHDIPNSWVQGNGLEINYTPKSDVGKSKIKVTFHYHIYGASGGDCKFLQYSFKLMRDGYDVPNKTGSRSGCTGDAHENITFYVDSWGMTPSKLSLALHRGAQYTAYLHRQTLYENKYTLSNLMPATIVVEEVISETN